MAESDSDERSSGQSPSIEAAPQASPNAVPSPPRANLRRFVGVMLVVYWLILFAAMHVQFDSTGPSIPGLDKVVHFAGYGVLGLLLSLWMSLRRALSVKTILGIMLTIGLYGIADELLQIPVGRDCDPADWVFDLVGASAGVAVVSLLNRQRP